MTLLKLKAADSDDLAFISAQMQDALVRFSDLKFDRKSRQFALVANRFAWDALPAKHRRRSGLHFENVVAIRRKGFAKVANDTILSLLTIGFEKTRAPSGHVVMKFSGGHSLALEVEYLSCALRDFGPAWSTQNAPQHDIDSPLNSQ
jgi:Protein of unknown function (DUF2948)